MDIGIQSKLFERFIPLNYSVFKIQRQTEANQILYTDELRLAILDSPHDKPPNVAVIIVPNGREHDWLFSTEEGHRQLLERHFNMSRLFVIGNITSNLNSHQYNLVEQSDSEKNYVQRCVSSILKPLIPSGVELKFINYFDGLVSRTTTHDFNVEPLGHYKITEELVSICGKMEWRRRLRFHKSANLIHTEVRLLQFDTRGIIIPVDRNDKRDVLHEVDTEDMVDSSWLAMKFGIETLFNQKESKQRKGLAFGSVGGAFLSILSVVSSLPLEIVCVDMDSIISQMILGCFGTPKSPALVYHLDPMLILQLYHAAPPNLPTRLAEFQAANHGEFDVLVVDLKEFVGDRLCAPLSIMSTLGCLRMMRAVICDDGLLVIHVIPSDYISYTDVLVNVKGAFEKVWKIGIDGDKDFILVASKDLTFVTPEGGLMSKFVLEQM